MAKIALNTGNGETGEGYEVYPADTYLCEIKEFQHKLSNFKDDKTGEDKYEFEITWEVYQLSGEQIEAGLTTGKWFKQWFSEYYGPTRNGDSKFKQFIDGLRAQGYLPDFDQSNFDTDDMIGIKQKVTVTEGTKKDGTPINKVVGTAPLKLQRRAPAAKPSAPAPAPRRNAPQPVAVAEGGEDDDGELF